MRVPTDALRGNALKYAAVIAHGLGEDQAKACFPAGDRIPCYPMDALQTRALRQYVGAVLGDGVDIPEDLL
jgi:hypothetical protein